MFFKLKQSAHKEQSGRIIEQVETSKANKRKEKEANSNEIPAKKRKQEEIDQLVVNFVSDAMLPFSTVENNSFKKLMNTAFPHKKILDRKQIVSELLKEFTSVKDDLKQTFEQLEYICLTADCWSIYHK